MSLAQPTSSMVQVYGTDTCEDTAATIRQLEKMRIAYEYVDIDANADAAAWVEEQNDGKRITPTVDFAGRIMIEPSEEELALAYRITRGRQNL